MGAADPAARDAAWDEFLKAYGRLLLHTARMLGRDHDSAMDAYAHLLEQLRLDDFRRLRAYASDGRSKFTTWLVVVSRRLCLDHLRHRYGRPTQGSARSQAIRLVRRQLVDLVADELDDARLATTATTDDPESHLRENELNAALGDATAGLEPRDRLLLKLRFDDGLPAREISQVMGFPTPFHVYQRLNALFGRLRTALHQRGIESPVP